MLVMEIAAGAETIDADLLVYRVTEADAEPYISRILVSGRFVRLDQGETESGFILFDREKWTVYSVSAEDQTVLEVHPDKRAPTQRGQLEVRRMPAQEAPEVDGVKPQYYRYLADGKVCREAFVLPGVMKRALKTLRAYRRLLADQEAATLSNIPKDVRTPCGDALNLHSPEAELEQGLPVRVWDEARREELLDYRTSFAVSYEAFELPEGYERMDLNKAP